MSARPHVAIVHDYLTQLGGAERVVLELTRAFPAAPVFTSLYAPDCTFPAFRDVDVRASALDRSSFLRAHHRAAFPLLAPTFSAMHVDADVVVCSSSGWAHGVRTTGAKLVYCYTVARWLSYLIIPAFAVPVTLRVWLRGGRWRLTGREPFLAGLVLLIGSLRYRQPAMLTLAILAAVAICRLAGRGEEQTDASSAMLN